MSADSAPRPRIGARGRAQWVQAMRERGLLAAAIVAVMAVNAIVQWGTVLPHFSADEIGMIGNSLRIAQPGAEWDLIGSSYMPGLAFLIAPAWWFTDDAVTVFHVGLIVNVLLSGLAVWVLSLVARDLGASRRLALASSTVVMVAPALLLSANYVLAERLLLVMTAASVHVAFRMSRAPSVRLGVWWGLSAGGAFLSHGRGLILPVLVVVVCAVNWRRWRWAALAAGATALSTSVIAYVALWVIARPMYDGISRESYVWDSVVSLHVADAVRAAIGQAWYVTLAWPAVAVIGGWWVVRRLRSEPWALFVGGSTLGAVALSATQTYDIPRPEPRLDVWIYGRYNDHIMAVLAVMGMVLVARILTARLALGVLLVSLAINAVFLLVTVPRIPVGGWYVDVHIAGVAPYLDMENVYHKRPERWLLLCVVAMILALVVLIAARVRRFHILALGLLWLFQSLSYDEVSLDARDALVVEAGTDPFSLEALPKDAKIGYASDTVNSLNLLTFTAWPREVTATTTEQILAGTGPDLDLVFVVPSEGLAPPPGVLVYGEREGSLLELWVLPGDVADELAEQGLAVPPSGRE